MTPSPTKFATALRAFFAQHLPLTRGLSPRTVLSYRDSFVLLLRFLAARHGCGVVDLELQHLRAGDALAFLDHLETERKNSVATRNARLAAIHAFARFLATRDPEPVEECQRLLAVPTKRGPTRAVDYLEGDEIGATAAGNTGPVFRNHRGEPMTRFGVRYLLRRFAEQARTAAPTIIAKRIHPHTCRHSAAVHLLRAGVDLVTISHWLGHASIEATNRYAAVDLETKRKALERAGPVTGTSECNVTTWRTDASVLEWLQSL